MAEPALSPPAQIVRELDPDLFRAALFAPEPLRGRLMILIAFDIELSKAVRASEPMIAMMRLQWWRDVVQDAFAGGPERAHEVAGPLARLISEGAVGREPFGRLLSAYENELEAPFSAAAFVAWKEDRVAPLLRLAAQTVEADVPAVDAVGRAMALAFAFRNGVAMATQGVFLLPVAGLDRTALARGETTDSARRVCADLASEVLADLAANRDAPRRLAPILRLGWRSPGLLKAAQAPGFELAKARALSPGTGMARLTWMALLGRW